MKNKTDKFLRSEDGSRQFSYFAFISYKHKDERWARWLQHQLEGYRLPNRLCTDSDRPRQLTPIFRDKTDLTGGKTVHTLLDEKLRASKFLIVICSRHMQDHPEYIDFEIKQFLALGNPAGNILPLIVDGEAASRDPALECLPPTLLHMGNERPLGITLDHRKKHDAILKLVAAMHGLEIQSIRAHDEIRRQRLYVSVASAILCSAIAVGALITWNVLSVAQANLREQNVGAQLLLNQGDRVRAGEAASAVLADLHPLMDAAIGEDAEKLRQLSAIAPALSPFARLEVSSEDKTLAFSPDGIVIGASSSVNRYSFDGAQTQALDIAKDGLETVALSADADRAVMQRIDTDGAALILYDLSGGSPIATLAQSDAFDQQDITAGHYDTVLSAAFSPNGQLVCAYRTGGYYNESTSLDVFDARTGETLVSLDASLLSSSGDQRTGQGNVIEDFEFVSNTLLHWTGSQYHVLHDMQSGKTHQIPLRDLAVSINKGLSANGFLSMRRERDAQTGDACVRLTNHLTGISELLSLDGQSMLLNQCRIWGGRYALLSIGDDSITPARATMAFLLDLEAFAIVGDMDLLAQSAYGCTDVDVLQSPGSDVVYLRLLHGGSTAEPVTLLRYDAAADELTRIQPTSRAFPDTAYTYVGAYGDTDLLLGRSDSGTAVWRIEGGMAERSSLDEPYDVFSQSACIGGTQDAPMLAAVHAGTYCLYPLLDPGVRLDANVPWDQSAAPVLAASEDGSVIARAQGRAYALFGGGDCLLMGEADRAVLGAAVHADGSRIALCTAKQLFVYDGSGALLASMPMENGWPMRSVRFTGEGNVLLLEAPASEIDEQGMRLRLLAGDTLTPIATISEHIHAHDEFVGDSFSVSGDGMRCAAVERVYIGTQYHRAVSIWSLEDGRLLARTTSLANTQDAATLDITSNVMAANAFAYVRFASSGKLLAGFDTGVWIFDPDALVTEGYVYCAASINGFPDQLPSGDIVYPSENVRILDPGSGMLRAILPIELMDSRIVKLTPNTASVSLSGNGRFLMVTGAQDTRLYDPDTWQLACVFADRPVSLAALNAHRAVYDTGDALHVISFE